MSGPAIERGWIRIARGRIVGLGRGRPPAPATACDDCIVLPGLVNAHTHLEFSDLPRPLDVTGGLPAWIERVVSLRRGRAPGAEPAAAVAAGLAESVREGVTSVGEIATRLPPAVVARLAARGPRVRVFREALGLAGAAAAAGATAVAADLDRLGARGIAGGVSPHAPYSVSAALGHRLVELAAARRLPVAMHVAEHEAEAEFVGHGTGPFHELLVALGVWPTPAPRLLPAADWISSLARAPRGLVVHGTWLDADPPALARLARHRARLAAVVCPRTTRALAGRPPPLAALRDAGVRVALGTDSRASNPDLSIRAECRALVDGGLAAPGDALAMATVHGAWALGFDDAGVLAPGRRADLVVLRPPAPSGPPEELALDPATRVVAVLRGGRLVSGALGP
jgi:cytosine/adenosine deaminase-related metal-dependent hydrolase